DDFFSLGGDSLTAAELVAEIEAIYGIQIPASDLLLASTVEQLAGIITTGQTESPSLVPIRVSGANPPFFCVHGISGEVISFRNLANYLSDDQPFYALRARPAGTTIASVEAMAAHYVTEIQQVQPEGPYFLGGYSFGGTVAFEIARQLVAQRKAVRLLALFDTYGPGYPKLLPARKRLAMHGKEFIRATPSEKLRLLRERILTNAIKVDKTVRRISYRYLMPSRLTRKDLKAEHQRILWNYAHKPFRGRMNLFRALDQNIAWHHDPFLGWNGLAAGGIQVHSVPGDHISLMAEPNVAELARTLGECLSRAGQDASAVTLDV
ncbi:MAG TPA: non-ribosomal peptide synthetase, partial [Blastocatellia bacterium]|nr:non-ribosomal peptide synthetase [Blastocatellia bacterium]